MTDAELSSETPYRSKSRAQSSILMTLLRFTAVLNYSDVLILSTVYAEQDKVALNTWERKILTQQGLWEITTNRKQENCTNATDVVAHIRGESLDKPEKYKS